MVRYLTHTIIGIAVALRIATLFSADDPNVSRPQLNAPLLASQSEDNHITHVRYQNFDPTAVVAVRPGPDRLPGVGGTDDNRNGVVDDRLELGATRSDDHCSVLTAEQLASISDDDVLVLQRGAFVPVAKGDVDSRRPTRAIVLGKSEQGRPWSVLVDLTDQK